MQKTADFGNPNQKQKMQKALSRSNNINGQRNRINDPRQGSTTGKIRKQAERSRGGENKKEYPR